MIPVVDLHRRLARSEDRYLDAVRRVLRSGTLLNGAELGEFEREAVDSFGRPHVVGVSSGAAAIQLALAALGVGPDDEVIVPAFTAVPTLSAVCALGATPVPVDVELDTALLSVDEAQRAVTARTKAIVPVHLYGRPVEVRPLASLGLPVVEDAAQAHGAVHGEASAAVAYSFYPTKNLGGIGDGGAVATSDADLAEAVRRRRVHGMTEQYVHVDISQNFRMSEVEAAWLRLQLPQLADDNHRRATIARRYREAAPHLTWQADHPDHVFHLCVARFADRDAARARLAERGVGTAVHYPLAITQQPAYHQFATRPCPTAEAWAAGCTSVPCFPELTDAEVETVAAALAELPA